MAIMVKFQCGDLLGSVMEELPKTVQLRDLQMGLCRYFKQPFPKKLAKVKVYDKTYDEFMDYPFENVIGEEIEAMVAFEDTTDLYFYDVADHIHMKYTIQDEIEWEAETACGETCLTFEDWMRSQTQRASLQAIVPEYPLVGRQALFDYS